MGRNEVAQGRAFIVVKAAKAPETFRVVKIRHHIHRDARRSKDRLDQGTCLLNCIHFKQLFYLDLEMTWDVACCACVRVCVCVCVRVRAYRSSLTWSIR
jgi:hypothetical protein